MVESYVECEECGKSFRNIFLDDDCQCPYCGANNNCQTEKEKYDEDQQKIADEYYDSKEAHEELRKASWPGYEF